MSQAPDDFAQLIEASEQHYAVMIDGILNSGTPVRQIGGALLGLDHEFADGEGYVQVAGYRLLTGCPGDEVLDTLVQARERHLSLLERAGAIGDPPSWSAFASAIGLERLDFECFQAFREKVRQRVAELEVMAPDSPYLESLARSLRIGVLGHLGNERLGALLIGGEAERARVLATQIIAHRTGIAPAGPFATDGTLVGLARFAAHMGQDLDAHWVDLICDPDSAREVHAELYNSRLGGDRNEDMLYRIGVLSPQKTPIATTEQMAVAQVHALLRCPRIVGGGDRAGIGEHVRVGVDEATFRALEHRYRNAPERVGLQIHRQVRGPWAPEEGRDPMGPDFSALEDDSVRILLGLRLKANLDGRGTTIEFMLELEEMPHANDTHLRGVAAEATARLLGPSAAEGMTEETTRLPVWSGAGHLPTYGADTHGVPALHEDLLGPRQCAHEGATWQLVPGRSPIEPSRARVDSFALNCPSCLRKRVVVEPLHRSPAELGDFIGKVISPEDYLAAETEMALLRSDERPVEDLAGLIARDGTFDPDPAAYTSDIPSGPPAPSASVRELLLRTRRGGEAIGARTRIT
ncbi:hypothetical protein [Miltoncostaea oceani]|uniref:hypothetical protein n=1 Tax=Miltoncostaea oceani TaxID=2843216 RepID=UPI001C3D9E66|nr:hypothetical protein [Miltoncostaea oceani]